MTAAAPTFRRVVVVGAGTMGHGIAQVAAMAGSEVVLCDAQPAALQRGLDAVAANLDKGVARGKVDAALRDASLRRLRGESDLGTACSGADLLVEAVPEDAGIKRRVFTTAAAALPKGAVVATNTSSIPLATLVDALPDAALFCGMHFFNPVHIQPLLEVVQAESTADATIDRVLAYARELGRDPIVVRDVAGFASSRLGLVLGLEAIRMLEQGVASAADIDKAMTLGYRHPMGPLALTDLVGLDVRLAIAETLAREIDPLRFAPPQLLRDLVAAGKLGKKSGEGFYRYES